MALVGWSLGGVVARELARLRPDLVRAVVTLGTPVVGGVRYVAVSYPWRRRGYDLDDHRALATEAARVPIRVPVTAIWSRRDGIVCGAACVDRDDSGRRERRSDLVALGTRLRPRRARGDRGGDLRDSAPMSGPIPDFSPLAAAYARSRPRYPDALFDFLADARPVAHGSPGTAPPAAARRRSASLATSNA